MILVFFSLFLFLVSGAVLAFILIPKFQILSSLEVQDLHAEKELEMKHEIIKNRIKRRFSDWKQLSVIVAEPLRIGADRGASLLHKAHQYLLEVREKQRRSKVVGGATLSKTPPSLDDKINQLLQEGRGYLFEERYNEAEQKFIEVISLDKKKLDSYKGLIEVYTEQKEWEHAKEILEYVAHIEKQPHVYYQLSDVYRKCGQDLDALEALKQALTYEGANPKFLDALVDMHITLNQRLKAEQALTKLIEINPENQKISEFNDRIKELAY